MTEDKDRVQREIEDILRKIDDFPSEAARIRAKRKKAEQGPPLGQRLTARFARITIPQIMLTGIVLVLVSYFLLIRIAPALGQYGIIAGLILFFSCFIISLWSGSSPGSSRPSGPTEKRWRGRVIEPTNNYAQPGWWERLRGRRR